MGPGGKGERNLSSVSATRWDRPKCGVTTSLPAGGAEIPDTPHTSVGQGKTGLFSLPPPKRKPNTLLHSLEKSVPRYKGLANQVKTAAGSSQLGFA